MQSTHSRYVPEIPIVTFPANASFQELRLADYNKGQRYGNANGQAGGFGAANSTFGGFGNSGGFGQQNNANTGAFGGGQQTSGGGFGGQTATSGGGNAFGGGGGGLFGSKPAGGGLFGNNATTTAQSGGGLFGTAGGTGGGFGGASTNTGGGLFGAQNNQPKPGGLFGNNNTNTTTSGTGFGGFGGAAGGNTGGGGLFGNNTANQGNTAGGGLFGNNNTTQQPSTGGGGMFGGGFGANNNNPQQQNQGQQTGGSLFGGFGNNANNAQQQKPGGLFGGTGTSTGGGLFGNNNTNNNQQPAAGGLFGGSNNQQSGGGLFGNNQANQQKPGGLFGSTPNTGNTGGGLFGGNNQQSNNQGGGGLFGGTNNQPKPGGLFGGGASTNTGGGLFGGTQNNTSGGLFGGNSSNQNQQQPPGGMFGSSMNNNNNNGNSLFGTPQNQQNNEPQNNGFSASVLDANPFGQQSIFTGMATPTNLSVGPIITPLSRPSTAKRTPIASWKSIPSSSLRLVTPPVAGTKRGYGWSPSNTPSSVSSTPGGLSNSLLGASGSFGRSFGKSLSLGKSLSHSNLRRSFLDDNTNSILAPGAFSAPSSGYGTGSLKKLHIDRNLRPASSLFAESPAPLPAANGVGGSKLKKKVSFDTAAETNDEPSTNGALIRTEENYAMPSAEEQGLLRSPKNNGFTNGAVPNGRPPLSEMEQVRGNELAVVHEDGVLEAPSPTQGPPKRPKLSEGEYWVKPSIQELKKMSPSQLKSISGFQAGREGYGYVDFKEPVDLMYNNLNANLEQLVNGTIIKVSTRSVTIYDDSPPMGCGLNVPARVYMHNSYPRGWNKDRVRKHNMSAMRVQKQRDLLQRVPDTRFIDWKPENGTWIFEVDHWTTYGFEEDDEDVDDTMDESQLSVLSQTPQPPTGQTERFSGTSPQDSSMFGDEPYMQGSPEDTFEFRKRSYVPGAFGNEAVFEEEDEEMEQQKEASDIGSFLDERSVDESEEEIDEPSELQEESSVMEDTTASVDMDMAGSFPQPTEQDNTIALFDQSINRRSALGLGSPLKPEIKLGTDWADQLQRSISPRKQDRQALRESQGAALRNKIDLMPTPKAKQTGGAIHTSMDLMNSLWGQEQGRRSTAGAAAKGRKSEGFEV